MNAYNGPGGKAPHILDLIIWWRQVVQLVPSVQCSVSHRLP